MIKIRLNQTRCTGSRFINENERHSRSRDPKKPAVFAPHFSAGTSAQRDNEIITQTRNLRDETLSLLRCERRWLCWLGRTTPSIFVDSGEQVPHGYDEFYAGVDGVVIGPQYLQSRAGLRPMALRPETRGRTQQPSARSLLHSKAWSSRCPANRPQSWPGSVNAAASTHISMAASPIQRFLAAVSSTG